MKGRELRSIVFEKGILDLFLEDVAIGPPADDEIVVRVEAAPINPSDVLQMLSFADVETMRSVGTAERPVLTMDVPEGRMATLRARLGQSVPAGNEGAGIVVAAGAQAKGLEGKRVALMGGAMYADYRKVRAADVIELPATASAADGASMFVNPLTALGFVETARLEGHGAIVHTAAASNLGQMLQRICLKDGIPLVNIVRSPEQVAILRNIGATHVIDSSDDEFMTQLVEALVETRATIAFDAIGGGAIGSAVLQAMERAAVSEMDKYNRYGSSTFKQLYIYGALDLSPIVLNREFGFQWSVSGWLLTPFMNRVGPQVVARLRQRVADELFTTFASTYTRTIGLAEMLQPDIFRAFERKATGEKYLVDPSLG